MKLLIKVTKKIYRKSMLCGIGDPNLPEIFCASIAENCAIALAVRELAPFASVQYRGIFWLKYDSTLITALQLNNKFSMAKAVKEVNMKSIRQILYTELDDATWNMIDSFDRATPTERLVLPEFSFEVDFPDILINRIGINQIKEILKNSETLQEV